MRALPKFNDYEAQTNYTHKDKGAAAARACKTSTFKLSSEYELWLYRVYNLTTVIILIPYAHIYLCL